MDIFVIAHIHLTYENLLTEGLDFSIGVYSLGNSVDLLPQPYNDGNYPVLNPGREVNFNLKYRFEL